MANSLDTSLPIASDGYATPKFEADWFDVTQLTVGEPAMDISLQMFADGFATEYFESLWNGVAVDLSKDELDTAIMLVNEGGRPTVELEALWEDLIT